MKLSEIYSLEPKEFFNHAREQFKKEKVHHSEYEFLKNQLEHLELLKKKHKESFINPSINTRITPNRFIQIKRYIEYGKKLLSSRQNNWESMQKSGLLEALQNIGLTINPTHNFEMLRSKRIELIENEKKKFIEERDINKLETTEIELNLFCLDCYNRELETIEQWLSDKYPNGEKKNKPSTSTQIEILKYKNYVSAEIENIKTYIKNTEEKALPPQQTEKPKPEQKTPKVFNELFYNIDLVQPSIDILKEIEPPLIDTDYNYIGKLKGIICVWIDELQRQGIIKHYSDRKIFASLIPQKIKRFSIDESMFGKYQKKAEENYRTDIKTKVSKIKLSQNSQKGKQRKLSL
jgi:hypothetical protein